MGSSRARALLLVAFSLLMLGVLETFGRYVLVRKYGGSVLAHHRSRPSREVHDELLGWRNRPNKHFENVWDKGVRVTHNSQGFRALEEYARDIPPGRFRIIFLGDSFTYGWGVGDRDTYPARLESLEPRLQTVNMSTNGHGIDQAYLWYKRDGMRLRADLLAFAVVHADFRRMRWDRAQVRRPKPRLALTDEGALRILGTPVPDWGDLRAQWWKSFLGNSALSLISRRLYFDHVLRIDPWPLARAVFEDVKRIAASRGHRFWLVYLPTEWEMDALDSGEPLEFVPRLAQYAERSGVPFLDLGPVFQSIEPGRRDQLFNPPPIFHFSERGGAVTADFLRRELSSRGVFDELDRSDSSGASAARSARR